VRRVVIAGGGTGGHLFPGIALAHELAARAIAVTFVGSDYGIERTAVPRAGFEVDLLSIRGLRGTGLGGAVRALWRVPASVVAAIGVLRRRRPDLVVGVGGYASFPAVVAAAAMRTPVVLLEQNSTPGLSTRALAPLATRICVSFADTARALGRKAVVTGNPVRALRGGAGGARGPESPGVASRVLVFGGSAGAHRLNTVVPAALALVARALTVTHQTGEADQALVAEAYRKAGIDARVVAFIEDMEGAYLAADLVICRAGATTIGELTAIGLPAILVPYPFAAGDHQRHNAETLATAGAAWLVPDRELEEARLAALVQGALADPAALRAMGERARTLGHPDAARRVADECVGVLGQDGRRVAGAEDGNATERSAR
jgi:UDP-N-acetylglucosamine--N-acetylmuramyl-(pentapeptide) pyrophosphoryl-undecaprenol N-acetylglucosamine transferase